MKHRFALSTIRKNGFLVYKNEKSRDMTIRKRSEYQSHDAFKSAVISFSSEEEAENFIKDHNLVSVEVVAIEL